MPLLMINIIFFSVYHFLISNMWHAIKNCETGKVEKCDPQITMEL